MLNDLEIRIGAWSHISFIMNPDNLRFAIDQVDRKIQRIMNRQSIDALVFSGISGAAVGFAVAAKLGLPMLYIRKESDDSHSGGGMIEGPDPLKVHGHKFRYIIVDDFMETGDTVDYMLTKISREVSDAECVAIVMYNGNAKSQGSKYKGTKVYCTSREGYKGVML